MMSWSTGEEIPEEYAPLMANDLRIRLQDRSESAFSAPVPPGDKVTIIGAGVAGICAAIKLDAAGIDFAVYEKNESIGGTWFENAYPGAGVDTPSHLYSYSFAKHDWGKYYALRDEVRDYLEKTASDFGVRDRIQFNTEVLGARYVPEAQQWDVDIRDAAGQVTTVRSDVVITAVGAFNRPKWPAIKGLDDFEGVTCHTARWPSDLDVRGKRIAVIGNGASAMQLVPAVAESVSQLTIFQRSPQWAVPFEKFLVPIPDGVRWLLQHVPMYQAWYRLLLGWIYNDRLHPSLQKDPTWHDPDRSLNSINDGHRGFLTRYIQSELGDRQDLLEAVLPTYPPFGKRILVDNGWFRTLTRDNVELVTTPIDRVTPRGVLTTDGTEYVVDVVVIATGFDVVRFLAPMELIGRSGQTIRDAWNDDDARAYLGLAVPEFPNLFTLYGPNLQPGHGGSLMSVLEHQMDYVMNLLEAMFDNGIGAVEVRKSVHDEYNERVDDAHANMIWTHPGMETYYRNSIGRVVVNNPFRVVDYWHMTRHPKLEDFELEPAVGRSGANAGAIAGADAGAGA
jgi:4-hydroxyacetophenone monooxygenase